jgi:hypothetical protein
MVAMQRRKLGWVLAGLAVVVAVGAVVLWPRPDRITLEHFEQVAEGMTLAEVEAILGPPGDYRSIRHTEVPPSTPVELICTFGQARVIFKSKSWHTDGGHASVAFDASGRAAFGFYAPQRVVPEDRTWPRVVRRAKELWHRWFA